ncbi:PBECR4 domain-containing protein [Bifidobacterium jacchi]|uniref:Phage-Barnase-EndoU-ColicinE5/D-RelE like nuclease 4 domain-containing protein n=1 Tax=Bifidobacterium jacchi TaxID=2490545 RepID=A0A5N5RKE2_9BIFI|nr:PBECR4 domain-containing protein [Bifidobacterium jacchi]KAB5607569.1 hypothetical protein EHS19_04465 [Bifidobacterium jacchi]
MRKPTDRQIRQWIPVMESASRLYQARLHHHLVLYCTGTPVLDVAIEEPQFMHLCGVANYHSAVSGNHGPQGFLTDAIAGKIDGAGLRFRDHPDDIKTKMAVIGQALETGNITLVVRSSYRGMCAFFGNTQWSIGVYATKTASSYVPEGKVTLPGSLTNRPTDWAGFPDRGCTVLNVTNIRVLP